MSWPDWRLAIFAISRGRATTPRDAEVPCSVNPAAVAASALAPLLLREDKAGFVVADMHDVDRFAPLDTLSAPTAPLYLVSGRDRGDHMANWSPDEAR